MLKIFDKKIMVDKSHIKYEDDYVKMERKCEDLIYVLYKNGVVVDEEINRKHVEARIKLSGYKNIKLQVDAAGVKYWTLSARKFSFSKEGVKMISATALIYHHKWQEIVLNWSLKFFSFNFPIKGFTQESEATKWLNSIKSN